MPKEEAVTTLYGVRLAQLVDDNGDSLGDALSLYAIPTVTAEHYRIHKGDGYTCSRKFTNVANGGVVEILFNNPVSNYPHFRHLEVLVSAGPCDVQLFEGVTTSADGTACNVQNHARNSSETADLTITYTPTVTDDGTELVIMGATGEKKVAGVGGEFAEEWMLKENAKSLLRVTNNSGGSITIWTKAFFYES